MVTKEYIAEHIRILKQLCLWKYMSDEEKEQLRHIKTKNECSVLMRRMRDRYYDQMIENFESSAEDEYLDVPLDELNLKTKTFYTLKRINIDTSGEFIQYIKENGWAKIPRFGCTLAKDIYMQIYDEMSEEEIEKLIKQTKNKGE